MTFPNQAHYTPQTALSSQLSSGSTSHDSLSDLDNELPPIKREELAADLILAPASLQQDIDSAALLLETDPLWPSLQGLFTFKEPGPLPYPVPRAAFVHLSDELQTSKSYFIDEATALLEHTNDAALQQRYQSAIDHLFANAHLQPPPQAPHLPPPPPTTKKDLKSKKRANLSKAAKRVLRMWFDAHFHHPYPTEEEKEMLSTEGGITLDQVNNWFINTRVREWKPKLHQILADNAKGDSKVLDAMLDKVKEPYQGQQRRDFTV